MAIKIFPTENDVGVNPGDGRAPTEANLTKWITSIRGPHSRLKRAFKIGPGGVLEAAGGGFGFDFVSGAATTVTLAPGEADVDGFDVVSDANLVTALTAATFNWVFLQLTKGGVPTKVTGAQLTVTTSASFASGPGPVPADSVLLFCFATSLTVITTQFDFRSSATDQITGEYLGDGNFSQAIDIGLRPKLVYVVSRDLPRLVAWSEPDFIQDQVIPTNFGSYIAELRDGRCGVAGILQDDAIRPRLLETGFQVNVGPTILDCTEILRGSKTFSVPVIPSLSTTTTDVTVLGAVVGDHAVATFEGIQTNARVILHSAIVVSANTVRIGFSNPSAGSSSATVVEDLRVMVLHENAATSSLNRLNDLYQFVAWY